MAVPSADFDFEIDYLTVRFEDRSGGEPTSWEWDFGDGTTSQEQNPEHEYEETGSYSVTLTVSNADGSDSVTKEVVPVRQVREDLLVFRRKTKVAVKL